MSQSTITLIIIAATCILYLTERFSVALTTVLGMLALVFTGILSFNDAFACFSSTTVMLVLGMIIIVDSLMESGVAGKLGHTLSKLMGMSEKGFAIIVFLTSGILSMFSNNTALITMYMPFIASLAVTSKGRITKKMTYLPLAMGSLIGGTGSLAGSTAPLLANDVLVTTEVESMRFFTPAPVALTIMGVLAVCYWMFLYDLQKKWFDFDEVVSEEENQAESFQIDKRKAAISVTVFIACIVLFVIQPFGWDLGLIAVAGAVVLMVTGCVHGQYAMSNMNWSALVTVGAALAIAKGFVASGVGAVIMNWLVSALGAWIVNPAALVALFLLAGFLLSQFMANGSLVSMLAAMAVPMAIEIGMNPMPAALACVFGSSLAMATPVATLTITMVQVAGYRFKDYLRMGGLVGVIGLVTAWGAIVLYYGLL